MNKIIIVIVTLFMTGCTVTNKSAISAPVGVSADSKLHGNIEVGDKISGSVEATYFIGIKLTGPDKYADLNWVGTGSLFNPVPQLKAAAAYNAISNSDAEIIVNPQYTITKNSAFGFVSYQIEVTGYRGVFTEFINKP